MTQYWSEYFICSTFHCLTIYTLRLLQFFTSCNNIWTKASINKKKNNKTCQSTPSIERWWTRCQQQAASFDSLYDGYMWQESWQKMFVQEFVIQIKVFKYLKLDQVVWVEDRKQPYLHVCPNCGNHANPIARLNSFTL